MCPVHFVIGLPVVMATILKLKRIVVLTVTLYLLSFRTCSLGVGRGDGLLSQSIPSAAGSTQTSRVDQREVVIVELLKIHRRVVVQSCVQDTALPTAVM